MVFRLIYLRAGARRNGDKRGDCKRQAESSHRDFYFITAFAIVCSCMLEVPS
jgi:hypothetical protein